MINLQDKIILLTGATSGIGKVAAVEIAKTGATLVLTSRNMVKGEEVKNEIIAASGNAKVEVMECDLSSIDSILHFSGKFSSMYFKLDVLINNAGTWETERTETSDGFEKMFAVNYLAPFLLSNQLLPLLKQEFPTRIIFVSSAAHKMGKLNFDDLQSKKHFSHFAAYSQSKLAVLMAANTLADKLKNTRVTVNSMHPGVVSTALFDKMKPWQVLLFRLMMVTPEKGAETIIYLATSPEVEKTSGCYFIKKKTASVSARATNNADAEKLWEMTNIMLKL